MAMQECPLPDVAASLGPYIKPREDVDRIRHEFQAHVQKQLSKDRTNLSSVSLLEQHVDPKRSTPATISGVRKAYLRALQAHSAAQARYDALKADLAQVSKEPVATNGTSAHSVFPVNETLVPLLRQREKHRKLQVIERTFSAVEVVGQQAVNVHLDDLVTQQAGDLPTPPTAQAPTFGDKPDVDGRILELKKAVLSTKRAGERQAQSDQSRSGKASTGRAGQVAGLQSALNELTGWMEQQLAIIGSAEQDAHGERTPVTNGHAEAVTLHDIEVLYEEYIAARESLLRSVSNPPTLTDTTLLSIPATSTDTSRSSFHPTTPVETLLPFLDTLTSTKREEQLLLQQSSLLRRQIASSEAETQRLTARLADESHLVHPGAGKGKDWAKAAAESSQATVEFAGQRLRAGEASADAAERVLEEIRRVPGLLDGLVVRTSTTEH